MFRRYVAALLVTGALAGSLASAGCADSPADTSLRTKRLRVSGSGSAMPLITLLTREFDSDEVEFAFLPGLHSGGGIRGAADGDLEIGVVSREPTAQERTLDIEYHKLSDDGLVLAANAAVTIDGLTSEQVRGIYAGTLTNWKQLGGPDLDIVVLDRAEDESAKVILRKYVLGADLVVSPSAVQMSYEDDMAGGLRDTEGAVGYLSLGFCLSKELPLRVLALDGVMPGVDTIESGEYAMVRPLGIVVAKPVPGELGGFLGWVKSAPARKLMSEHGFAPPAYPGSSE